MPGTKSELQQQIRFALFQLASQNKHHDFEHLARQIARRRIASNVLPATGPVAGLGDQGRDFETFASFIRHSPIADSTFVALVAEKRLAFACSLQQQKIGSKIKSDANTIIDSGVHFDALYYFCGADLPVGKRHQLENWADSKHHCKLTILDGQTISEQLTDHDLWWIAQEYLAIAADAFPHDLSDGGRYSILRTRWLQDSREPYSFADFVEVDDGLRHAMYERGSRADLPSWLRKIRTLLREGCPQGMKRKVQYEIAVASLKGLNNLSVEAPLVADFFDGMHAGLSPAELRDAEVLLTYCTTAALQDHFECDLGKLDQWASALTALLDEAISRAAGKSLQCDLLLIRAQMSFISLVRSKRGAMMNEMLDYWERLLRLAGDAPLFALQRFADLITLATPFLANNPRYTKITDRLDRLLEKRSSGFMAAEKCLDRARALVQDKHFIKALKEIQRAKIKWFAAETLLKAISAMLRAGECYEHLKLFYAAKYYAAAAVYILFRETNQELKQFLPRAVFLLCRACYASGASLSYMEALSLALLSQQTYMPDPFDFEKHPALQEAVTQAAILRAVTQRIAAELLPTIDQMGAGWELAADIWSDVADLSESDSSSWGSLSSDELWSRIQIEMGGPIFSDVGPRRSIRWPALGITWTISFANTYELTLLGEELAATLQIIQADLAEIDLCLFPTTADIELELTQENSPTFEEVPDNRRARWLVRLPDRWLPPHPTDPDEGLNPLTLAMTILSQCTALSFRQFKPILNAAFKTGLASNAFTVRPARELFANIHSKDSFLAIKRSELTPPESPEWFKVDAAAELAWRVSPGPGYSLKKAEGFIRNRYKNSIRPIRLTLSRLRSDPHALSLLKKMHEDGLPDWQILNILASMVTNFRVRNEIGSTDDVNLMRETFAKWMYHDEQPDDPMFPSDLLTEQEVLFAKNVAVAGNLHTWGLISNLRTPDFAAIRRFLDVRYNNSSDDVPHANYFGDWD